MIIGGDLNEHVGQEREGVSRLHRGWRVGQRKERQGEKQRRQ